MTWLSHHRLLRASGIVYMSHGSMGNQLSHENQPVLLLQMDGMILHFIPGFLFLRIGCPLDELERAYKTQYYRCYKKDLSWNIKENLCLDSTVDFGALNEKMQMQIVETVSK